MSEHLYVKGRAVIPIARVRIDRDETVTFVGRQALAPQETSDGWWGAVVNDPRVRSPRLGRECDLRLRDLNEFRPLIVTCQSCGMTKQLDVRALKKERGDDSFLDTVASWVCAENRGLRSCHARWRQDR